VGRKVGFLKDGLKGGTRNLSRWGVSQGKLAQRPLGKVRGNQDGIVGKLRVRNLGVTVGGMSSPSLQKVKKTTEGDARWGGVKFGRGVASEKQGPPNSQTRQRKHGKKKRTSREESRLFAKRPVKKFYGKTADSSIRPHPKHLPSTLSGIIWKLCKSFTGRTKMPIKAGDVRKRCQCRSKMGALHNLMNRPGKPTQEKNCDQR